MSAHLQSGRAAIGGAGVCHTSLSLAHLSMKREQSESCRSCADL